MCPHKRAFVLSDGLIGDDDAGKYWVSCPYHKRNYDLNGEQAGRCSNDESMNIATFPAEEREDGWVYLKLPPTEEFVRTPDTFVSFLKTHSHTHTVTHTESTPGSADTALDCSK